MRIEPFTFQPELLDLFVRFGYGHYQGDKNWIPPFEDELRHQLSPESVFCARPENAHRHFLALDHGHVLGRVTAFDNSDLKDDQGTRLGALGYFEVVPDFAVSKKLIGAATDWLRHERRLTRVWGPLNFDIWHGYRFMTRGFGEPLFVGEPYNKPYYPQFFERIGGRVRAEWDSVEITGRETLSRMIERGRKRYELLLERGYHFVPFDPSDWDREVAKLHDIICRSFSRFPGFHAITQTEFARLFAGGRQSLVPELFAWAHDESGKLAGFAAGFLELSDAVRAMQGRRNVISKLRFLGRRRHTDCINFYLGAITPEEQARGTGLGRAGFYCVINQSLAAGYEKVLMALRLVGNPSRGLTARFAPEPQREYALYELDL